VGAEEERNRVAHEQKTRETQQKRKEQRGPERQRHSKAAHGQGNWKAQQEEQEAAHPQRGKVQQERDIRELLYDCLDHTVGFA